MKTKTCARLPAIASKHFERTERVRKLIHRIHIWLGLIVAIPVLAWASSGLLYAWPNAVEGGKIENIDATRVRVPPSEAMAKASEFAGRKLPTTALTLLMRDGRPVYQAVGGMGADSLLDRRGNRNSDQGSATRRAYEILPAGAFLLLCGLLAGDPAHPFCRAGVRLDAVRSIFESDNVVWKAVQA